MAWDKTLPSGSKAGNLLDDDIQTNNIALETALDAEHTFTSGGSQDGRHHFKVDTKANLELVTEYVNGMFAYATDVVSGYNVPYYTDGTSWRHVLEPYLNNANVWVKGQHYTAKALTAGAAIASNWSDGEVFTVTLDQPSVLSSPTVSAGKHDVRYYVITNDNPATTLTYDTAFTVDNVNMSTGPTINSTASSVTVLKAYQISDSVILLSSLTSDKDLTWNLGFYEIPGTGMLFQWVLATAVTSLDTITFATPFADANYIVTLTAEEITPGSVHVSSKTAANFVVIDDIAGTIAKLHVMAIGLKP